MVAEEQGSQGASAAPQLRSPLPQAFYARDALVVARDLLGKLIVREAVVLRITEVEAYRWPDDTANHCRMGRGNAVPLKSHLLGQRVPLAPKRDSFFVGDKSACVIRACADKCFHVHLPFVAATLPRFSFPGEVESPPVLLSGFPRCVLGVVNFCHDPQSSALAVRSTNDGLTFRHGGRGASNRSRRRSAIWQNPIGHPS